MIKLALLCFKFTLNRSPLHKKKKCNRFWLLLCKLVPKQQQKYSQRYFYSQHVYYDNKQKHTKSQGQIKKYMYPAGSRTTPSDH